MTGFEPDFCFELPKEDCSNARNNVNIKNVFPKSSLRVWFYITSDEVAACST